MKYIIYHLWIISLLFPLGMQAKVRLTSIWGDNMVLQQQSEVTFHGKASANSKITIEASWNHRELTIRSDQHGNWDIQLPTPAAGGPYTITFSDGEALTLKNILLGEVWFCSGQSNMEMPVRGFRGQPVYGSQPYIVAADSKRKLRLFTVKRDWSTTPKEEGITGHWSELSPKEVGDFSATAYFFGDLLQRSLDIPVGLIHCSWSASKIETWMNKETLSQFPEVQLPDIEQTKFDWPAGTPTLLWNAMVNPWKGLPVYYVQITPWQAEGKDRLDRAWFRQCQLELMQEVPNVGMVTTTDAGSEKFIHPPYKIKVGQRLAYWALAKTYGKEGFLYAGPLYKSHQLKDNVVEITFEHGSDGLIPENQKLRGFELVDEKGNIVPAEAEIINGSARVKVWNDSVSHPVEVRYCFRNYMEGDLFNNAEIPASPFRAVIHQ